MQAQKQMYTCILIAVMFTFSFGSAFAVTGSIYNYGQAYDLLNKTESDLIAAEKVNMDYAVKNYTLATLTNAGSAGDLGISQDAAKVVYQDLYDDYCAKVNAMVKAQKDAVDALYASDTSIKFEDGDTAFGTVKFDTATISNIAAPVYTVTDTSIVSASDVAEAEFDVVKANQLVALGKLDAKDYSTTKAAGASETPAQTAERLIAQAIAQVNGFTVATNDQLNDIATKINFIKEIYTAGEGTADPTGKLFLGGTVNTNFDYGTGLTALTKASAEVKDNAKLEYAKAKVLASLTGEINTAMNTAVNTLEAAILAEKLKPAPSTKVIAQKEAEIADTKADYAKILEVVTYYVNYQEDWNKLATFDSSNVYTGSILSYSDANGLATNTNVTVTMTPGTAFNSYTKTNMIAMAKHVVALKEKADLAKATVDIAGATYVEIDAALEDAIENVYINGVKDTTAFNATAEDYLYHYVENKLVGSTNTNVRINTVDYDSINAWTYNLDPNYDEAKRDTVKAIAKETKAAVRAAATVADADAAFLAGYAKFDEVPTAAEHSKDFLSGKYKAKYDAAVAEVNAYASYKNGLYDADGGYQKGAANTLVDTYTDGTNGKLYTKCFDEAELTAMVAEAKAAIDGIKTKAAVKAEAAAIEAEINALPKLAAVTLADKDAILAVFDKVIAHNDYCEKIGDTTNEVRTGTIKMLAGKIADLEEEVITDAYNAIYKDGKVTVDEAVAVADLRAKFDAYEDLWSKDDYSTFNIYNNSLLGASGADMDDAEADLLKAQVLEVVKLVNALPATGATAADVKAANDAFEALGRDGKDMLYHDYPNQYSKLIDAQKLIDATTGVETLKITAGSTAKKGSITVKWTVKGVGDRDGFQIWKSTKKNKGFKKAFTTTKTTYKNTKGLKKGTRYYYKVRAYQVVDGKNVYSDWSNKAIRIAK